MDAVVAAGRVALRGSRRAVWLRSIAVAADGPRTGDAPAGPRSAPPSLYTRGPVNETVSIWVRVLELAEDMEDTEYQLRALYGIWLYKVLVCEYRAALALAQQLRRVAGRRATQTDLAMADRMMAMALHYLGDQAGTCACAIRTLSAPVTTNRHVQTMHYGRGSASGSAGLAAVRVSGFGCKGSRTGQYKRHKPASTRPPRSATRTQCASRWLTQPV